MSTYATLNSQINRAGSIQLEAMLQLMKDKCFSMDLLGMYALESMAQCVDLTITKIRSDVTRPDTPYCLRPN